MRIRLKRSLWEGKEPLRLCDADGYLLGVAGAPEWFSVVDEPEQGNSALQLQFSKWRCIVDGRGRSDVPGRGWFVTH